MPSDPNEIAAAPARRVLLVDDYPDALEIWALLLEASGYSVLTASSGAAALRHVDESAPHVAVLDLQLPDVSGLEVARRLRAGPGTSSMTLIALTGRALTPDGEKELAETFDSVLIKPCDAAVLLASIEKSVRGARAPGMGPNG